MAITHRDVGTWITMTGKTRHGKNRIQQHGMKWLIMKVASFQGQPAMLLRSFDRTDRGDFDSRWVVLRDDPNFLWFH